MPQSLRIVVADDDCDMLHYYVRIIPHLGHTLIAQAANGRELADLCLHLRPDVAVSDVQMPQLDGISAMELVQREADIPFVFVSADDQSQHRDRLSHGHVIAYLAKPFTQAELLSAINSSARVTSSESVSHRDL